MPRMSAWFVRASLIYLVGGFTLGAILLINKGVVINPVIWKFLPIHTEVLLMGWFIQLVAGIAYWILPRLGGLQPRGSLAMIQLSFALINTGILLVFFYVIYDFQIFFILGRVIEFGGVLSFVIASWKRVKTFRS